jgi:hypothetical protein
MVVYKRERLVNKRSESLGMVRAGMVFLFKDTPAILADGHGTHVGARLYVQNARHILSECVKYINLNKMQIYSFFPQFLLLLQKFN